MRIELSIKTTYLPEWGAKEGIRELLQNAKDAEIEFRAPMKVWHNGSLLRIESKGVKLPHEALLLGYTTKLEQSELIGHFGEGLKIGCLALIRSGHTITIRSGEEIWKPILIKSTGFQAEVLAFDIRKSKDCGGVIVEVGQISFVEWEEMRENFLFLLDKVDKVEGGDYGDILLDPIMQGKLYVKGIFVQTEPKLNFGYNMLNAPTDRDRKVIAQYELGWRLATIWRNAVSSRPDLIQKMFDMLVVGAFDTDSMSAYNVSCMSQEIKDKIITIFKSSFGDEAIPVASISESRDVGHLGRVGVVLSRNLAEILQTLMGLEGGIKSVAEKLGIQIVQRHSWNDLSKKEQDNLEQAIAIIGWAGENIPMEDLEVVTFRAPEALGQWDNGKIIISKLCLASKTLTLTTLIHELAHHLSRKGDGDKAHIMYIEHIWAGIFTALDK